jgi:hypothetical protein
MEGKLPGRREGRQTERAFARVNLLVAVKLTGSEW